MESARRAAAGDLSVLATMSAAAAAETRTKRGGIRLLQERPLPPERLTTLIDDPDTLMLVGEYDGVPLGYAWVTFTAAPVRLARLEHLWVDVDARDVAIGEVLMDAVLAAAGERGCDAVESVALPGDRQTKNFFERYGLTARLIVVSRQLSPANGDHVD